ncbi:hypothetical protein M0R45_006716 [Rubus argutus]|uniref:Uncharacterized protein n=1 Tax=Rubus argutus TaxID=59490 RepID=A0AAW1YRA7_RUBAR
MSVGGGGKLVRGSNFGGLVRRCSGRSLMEAIGDGGGDLSSHGSGDGVCNGRNSSGQRSRSVRPGQWARRQQLGYDGGEVVMVI